MWEGPCTSTGGFLREGSVLPQKPSYIALYRSGMRRSRRGGARFHSERGQSGYVSISMRWERGPVLVVPPKSAAMLGGGPSIA